MMADTQAKYFDKLIGDCITHGQNPIIIVRFEDLVADPIPSVTQVGQFMLDLEDISDTNLERRINEIKAMGDKATQTYQLKDNTKQFNKSVSKYTDEQISYIKQKLGKWIHYLGYADVSNNPTGYFKFEGDVPAEWTSCNYGFRQNNEAIIKKLAADGGWKGPKYPINHGTGCFDLFSAKDLPHVMHPSKDFARRKLGYEGIPLEINKANDK